MRTLLALLLTVTSLRAASIIPIPFAGTNTLTPAWWTTTDTNATGVAPWKAWQAVNTNFDTLQGEITTLASGLPDAQTNAVLDSLRQPATAPTGAGMAAGATNIVGWITNFAGMTYDVVIGTPQLMFSFDGATWSPGNQSLVTNTPVRIAFYSGYILSQNATQIPMPGAVTNLVIYTLNRPDLFGKTNALYGQEFRVGPPIDPDDVTPKNYVDSLFAATPWWSAGGDVQINSHAVNLSGTWKLWTAASTNADACKVSWLGMDILTAQEPAPTIVTGTSIALDGTGTNMVISVSTNGLTASPRLKLSHNLTPPVWTYLTNTPSIIGATYSWTVPLPYTDMGFLMTVVPSVSPGLITLSGVLQLAPLTITNAASSTWGYGAGILCADTNYVYISVGSNSWKRAALTSW